MNLIPTSVTRSVARQVLIAKKNSPHFFFVGGVIGVIGSTVMACRATLKLEETVDDVKKGLEIAKSNKDVVSDQEYNKKLGQEYGKAAVKLGKLYGPAVLVGTASIAALTGSHIQLTRRNTALTATLAAVMKSYDEYRIRVQEEIGKEKELEIHRGITEEKNDKKELVKGVNSGALSPYARVFDESSRCWEKSSELNRMFLTAQQNYFNQRLYAYGYVFLNDVYEGLGFERTSAGQIVGWVLNGDKDGFVDFGIFEERNLRFVNNLERSAWLDFNVDGPVQHLIDNL